jgi:ABC-type multidrug transport system fused ATPase/permease subunit
MSEVFSRIRVSGKQVAAVVTFVIVAAVAQMVIPSLLGAMIDEGVGQSRTSFVIAHRLSTIRDADVILYMENGDIKEVGNHNTLMACGGKYVELYNSQFG